MATTSNSSATPSLATTPATTPTALTTAATTAKRLGYTSPSSSSATASVICEEVFDEACLPSAEEINDYATLIGIEPSKETHLLYLAKEGLMAALPAEWKICYSEEKSGHYYHNTRTKQSQWDHPLDAVYRELVEQTRHKLQSTTGVATPVIDNSEDMSQLDSGIRSMQGNDELLEDQTSNSQQQGMAVVGAGLGVLGKTNTAGLPATGGGTALGGGFSGGVSRFLETRAKNFGGNFQPVKNTRFEVAKISLAMKFAQPTPTTTTAVEPGAPVRKTGFQLSGSGAMFLKSRRQLEQPQATPSTGGVELPKGILRDSSLTDMRRRGEREEDALTVAGEDKKSVRFNLEQTVRIRSSSEADEREREQEPQQTVEQELEEEEQDDDSKLGSSSEEQAEEQQEAEELEDAEELEPEDLEPEEQGGDLQHDLWDEHVAMCRLKPYISDANKTIRVINLPKAQTIQMLEEVGAKSSSCTSYLDKLKESAAAAVKPLYEDTDSDSKGSSVRSFIVNKSELENASLQHSNPFDLDALGRQHSHELEQLQRKSAQATQLNTDKLGLRSLKMASKLVGLLKQQEQSSSSDSDMLNEAAALQQLQQDMQSIKREHEVRLKSLRHEYELRLTSHRHQLEETFALQLAEYRLQLEQQLQLQRVQVVTEHKTHMATLQSNHAELLHELERDLASEQELLRREHAAKLQQQRDKHAHELEVERQRLRETGEERMYEKLRCEKRLLEDKYRCLKEKYVRLKTDVKLSLERRSRRREAQAQAQALQQHHNHHHHGTTNSETERSSSQKPSIGNSENRSLSYTERGVGVAAGSASGAATGGATGLATPAGTGVKLKPPVPPKTHLSKPNVASKYLQQLQDDNNTSLSQSDTTISNNYSKGRYLAVATPTATPTPTPTVTPSASGSASAVVLSDNGNSDSEAIALALHSQHQEHINNNNNNVNNNKCLLPRKKLFSRTKSASTSRLNADNYRPLERPCTPVENLRHQLQKLEDLEDQFPEHTLEATYHLRYPFTDMGNEQLALLGTVVGSELEFFKHRIHLERDAVRRAKDSLRTQRNSFRARQREIRQRHKSLQLVATAPRQCLDQLMLEEKELSEMEVNLHRTRALLGEKVIRLRQLEQSLWRICEQEQPALELDVKEEAATLSDLSSHSSSGFSSTDFASGADLHKRKEYFQQESNECIQNLEILNAEIREILDILSQKQLHQQHQHQQSSLPSLMAPNELSWSHMLGGQSSSSHVGAAAASAAAGSSSSAGAAASSSSAAAVAPLVHAPQSIPTLADRLETYRQLAAGRMHSSMGGAILAANTIVSQSPRAVNYTTSLVERTRDLRNWLRQAKTEHELLTGMGLSMHSTGAASGPGLGGIGGIGAAVGGTQPTAATATPSASGGGVAASAAASATEAAQTNL